MVEESDVVEIAAPERKRFRWWMAAVPALLVLAVLVAVLARRPSPRVSVVPMRGDMQAVVVMLPRAEEVRGAWLVRPDGGRQESSSLPGRTDVVIFFVAEGESSWPARVEVDAGGKKMVLEVRP